MPARSHGASNTPLYGMWREMRRRCRNPNHHAWQYYGGKGVRVCPEWDDFAAFRDWAEAHGYGPGQTIERLDAAGNYEPGNCEWITRSENARRAMLMRWVRYREARL